MGQVFAAFGIDWRILLINALNFALLMLVLWYLLYGPLMRILEERRQKVVQGVKDAEAAQERLAEIENSRAQMLQKAGQEADEVVSKAHELGGEKEKQIIMQGEQTAASILKDAKAEAAELKHQAIEESKKEVAKLIVLGLEKGIASK